MRTLLTATLCLFLFACSNEAEEKSPLTHSADGTRYVNTHFGLQVDKPAGWYSQDPKATMALSAKGANMMAGDDKNMKAMLEESLRTSVPLFAFFEHVPGAAVETNPNILAVAENISILPGIKTGCDYLFHVRQMLANSAVQVSISEGCQTLSVNGAPFGYVDMRMDLGGTPVLQRMLACVQGEHAIGVAQTYFDDASKAKVDAVLDSLKVNCS